MSKSKSRHSSRQASAASRNGASGTVSKSPAKIAAKDAPQSTEEKALTAVEEASEETIAAEEVSETEEAPTSTTAKLASDKATKKTTTEATEKKESSSEKAGKLDSSSGKGTPAKAAAKGVPGTPQPQAVLYRSSGAGSKTRSRDAAKYERRQQERQMRYLAERRARRNLIITIVSAVLILALLASGLYFFVYRPYFSSLAHAKAAPGTYQEPIYNTNYPPIDSVYCDQGEQNVEHIHAYVVMYIDGTARSLPADVGIPQSQNGGTTCLYWLHTHDSSGIIHIESPFTETFTFGQFRDMWDQVFVTLNFPPELLLNTGWTVWINGQPYHGTLGSIPLAAHNIITLAYGSPRAKPATTYNWNGL